MNRGPTLTEALAERGYSHARVARRTGIRPYAHDVMNASGVVVFTGTAREVWAWLAVMA